VEFLLHGGRKDHPLKDAGKRINVADQDQVVNGPGIGDDQL
jgi:hypothetical protein